MTQAADVVRKVTVVMPPGILVEHRRRPVTLPWAFQCIVKAVRIEEVHSEHILPVSDPFHPLHGGIHEDAAERFAEEPFAAELMRSRTRHLDSDMFIRPITVADERI